MHMSRWTPASGWVILGTTIVCALVGSSAAAVEPQNAGNSVQPATRQFESAVAPILAKTCLGCHNGSEASGGLDMTRGQSLIKGGDSGPAIIAGKPDESYLIQRLRDGEMPPEGKGKPPLEARDRRPGRLGRRRRALARGPRARSL